MKVFEGLTLDFLNRNLRTINAKQNDTESRYLDISIHNNSLPINLTGHTVKVFMDKPDGTKIFNDAAIITASAGLVRLELTTQALAVPGTLNCELVLYGADETVVSSQIFKINVTASLRDDEAVESSNEFGALTQAMAAIADLEGNYVPRLNSVETQLAENVAQLNSIAVNVQNFGAIGDGTTDDSDAIQSAINSANNGDTIIVGKHFCSKKITITKPIRIIGKEHRNGNYSSGEINSCLKFANVPIAIEAIGTNIALENVIITGVGADTSTGTGIKVTDGTLTINDVSIQSFNTGLMVIRGYYNKLNNSFIGFCKTNMVFDNCYNINAVGVTLMADNLCIELKNTCTMRMLGGSIERFSSTGVLVGENSQIDLFGTYFEGGGSLGGYGVNLGNHASVNAIGCHLYLTSMAAFISVADVSNTVGVRIYSRNNKIVYPTDTKTTTAYRFKTNDKFAYIDIAGDSWQSTVGANTAYIPPAAFAAQLAQSGNYHIQLPSQHPDSGIKDINTSNLISAKTQVTPATPTEGEILFFMNLGYGTDDPLNLKNKAWGYKSYRAVYQNGRWEKVGVRIPNQLNSTATDIATLVSDFNSLLQKLRDNGVMV